MSDKYIYYAADSVSQLNLSKKQDTTVYFNQKTKYKIIQDCGVYVEMKKPAVNFGTLIDNKIVSVATWNELNNYIETGTNVIEITMGTNINHRKKGYALSNLIALCEFILKIKAVDLVTATIEKDNIASIKTAESAGMFRISRKEIEEIEKIEKRKR